MKIQTGLRLPEELYELLKETADRTGVSVNAQILYLVDVGLQAVNLGIRAERHVLARSQPDTDG